MAQYKVEICGVNKSKLPLLTEDEKEQLFKEIAKGNKEARDTYIKGNLRLVLSIIQRFTNSNENIDDLFQIGCIGLIKAIDNFDVTLNVKFSTYAVPMIIGEVRRFLRDNNSIRVSRSLRDIAYKAIYTKEAMMKKSDREPTIEEIAKELDVPAEDIVFALDAIQSPVSLYEPVYSEGGYTLYHGPDQRYEKQRGKLGGNALSARSHENSSRTGKKHHRSSVFSRKNPDGSSRRNPYLPGPGFPSGKECTGYHENSPGVIRITFAFAPSS